MHVLGRTATLVVCGLIGALVPAQAEVSDQGPVDLGSFGSVVIPKAVDGDLVVGEAWREEDGSILRRAFVADLSSGEPMRDLGTLGGVRATAYDVEGDIVVGKAKDTEGRTRAFVMDLASGEPMRDLGALGGGTSRAYAIEDGVVVGTAKNRDGDARLVRFDLNDASPELVRLPMKGWRRAQVADMDGDVVVGTVHGRGRHHAFAVDLAGGTPRFVDLGTLGGRTSVADLDGRIVVGWSIPAGERSPRAFIANLDADRPRVRQFVPRTDVWSVAVAVDGRWVAGAYSPSPTQRDVPFLYDRRAPAKGLLRIGSLGGSSTTIVAIDRPYVVGTANRAGDGAPRAFFSDLRTDDRELRDLGALEAKSWADLIQGTSVVGTASFQRAPGEWGTVLAAWTIEPPPPVEVEFTRFRYAGAEGDEVVVAVRRHGDLAGGVTVHYEAVPGDGPADFEPTAGTLTFAPGETRQTFTVPVLDDDLPEDKERFLLLLEDPTGGAGLGTPNAAALVVEPSDLP